MFQPNSVSKWQLSDSQDTLIRLSVLGELIITLLILIYHTKKLFRLRMFNQIHSCMDLVNYIYERGNASQKVAVNEIYISFLRDLQCTCTRAEWNLVIAMMPDSLYKVYTMPDSNAKI